MHFGLKNLWRPSAVRGVKRRSFTYQEAEEPHLALRTSGQLDDREETAVERFHVHLHRYIEP